MQVLGIVGSLGESSKNHALMALAARSAPIPIEVRIAPSLGDLPHFNPDLPAESAPAAVHTLRRLVVESDALFILCPEYAFSFPGVLKNAIDWLVGTGELEQKLVAISASVPHASRGLEGLAALRHPLRAVSAKVAFDEPIVRGSETLALGRMFSCLLMAHQG